MAISGTTSGPELLVRTRPQPHPNRCTVSSPTGCAMPFAPAGSRLRPGCRRAGCWPPTSGSRAGWSWRPTASWSPRVSCSACTAPAPGWPPSTPPARRSATAATQAARFDIDFAPGSPDLGSFPRHAWLRALRQGLTEIESDAFGYVAPQGLPAARDRSGRLSAAHPRRARRPATDRALLRGDTGHRPARPGRAGDAVRDGGPRVLVASDGAAAQRYRTRSGAGR